MADDVRKSTDLEVWHKNPLERAGWKKNQLIRQLALGELTQARLGEMYGVSQASISRFGTRHRADIEMVRAQLAERAQEGMEHLWAANKVNRVAEYQATAERMNDVNTPRAHEIKITALKAVADELGELPARTQVSIEQSTVTYEIVGMDPETDI
ncbi:hypothetical protein [Streptomyces tendae]|uniref:hypothetical protein n=1 Tax=Streptomyces tendae TaxID=1932 RepID=UPI003D74C28B